MSRPNVKRRNPLVAVILSGILPGLGQIYNAQIVKGLILVAIGILINILIYIDIGDFVLRFYQNRGLIEITPQDMPVMLAVLGYSTAWLVLLLYAVIDAKKTADRLNERRGV